MKLLFCSFILLFLFFPFFIKSNVFIPKREPDISDLPPFVKNLSKYEKYEDKAEDKKTLKTVVSQIVDADDAQLEKKADELLKDHKKLNQFLSVFSGQGTGFGSNGFVSNGFGSKEFVPIEVPVQIQPLLDDQYKIEKLINTKMSVNVKQASVIDLIELISKTTDINFVIDPDVAGMVSGIHLKDISAAIVLRYILSNNNPQLALLQDFDVFRIVKLSSAIQILKGRLAEELQKELVSSFFILQNAKLTDKLKSHIEQMWLGLVGKIKDDVGAYLVFDEKTRKIFFRGKQNQVDSFKEFLQEIDIRIPQVKIEARVVIAKKDFEESIGFDWSGLYDRSSSIGQGWNWFGLGKINQDIGGAVPATSLVNWALNFFPTNWAANGNFSMPFIFGSKNLDHRRLNLKLNAAESKSEIKTLLKPTLFVNSHELAEILVGKEVPIQTIITDYTEAKMRNLETINYKELGMKLRVKPIVSPDCESVFLDIFVEHSSILDGDTKTFDYKTSQILKTMSQNRVLLKSGQTTLIGGLISNQKSKDRRGIPYLSRIPVLGLLFGSKRKVKVDEQLLIFITPTIV